MADIIQGNHDIDIDIEEVEYLRHGGKPFLARVFRPRGDGPFPAVIDAHGGAWCEGARTNNDTINAAVAAGGVVVASLDFRSPPDASYPGSVADVHYGVRWLKSQAVRFGSAPELVGSMGTSSGGHLVVLAALKADDPRYTAIPLASDASFNGHVTYVVSLWPVICPLSRYRELKARLAAGADNTNWERILANQDRYWLTEDAMAEGSPNFALERGDAIAKPNILYMQNPNDPLHPRANLDSFVAGYRAGGGNLQLEFFAGDKYDEIRSNPSSPDARNAIAKIVAFINRQTATKGFA